jgi:hypothetical protein
MFFKLGFINQNDENIPLLKRALTEMLKTHDSYTAFTMLIISALADG